MLRVLLRVQRAVLLGTALLMAASVLSHGPVRAATALGWDQFEFCSPSQTQYCIQEFRINGVDMSTSTEWQADVRRETPTSGDGFFLWRVWAPGDTWPAPAPHVKLRINSGDIKPNMSSGKVEYPSITHGGNPTDGYTFEIDGYASRFHYLQIAGGPCQEEGQCGDETTQANHSNMLFTGVTQDLTAHDPSTRAYQSGSWTMTNAEYYNTPYFERDPAPRWVVKIGNPHLQVDGVTPAVGHFAMKVSPGMLAAMGTTPDEAVSTGLHVTRQDGSAVTTVGASMNATLDGGVIIRLPQIHFSTPTVRIRESAAARRIFLAPGPPRDVAGRALDGAARVSFRAPRIDGGTLISSYAARCSYFDAGASTTRTVQRSAATAVAIEVPLPNAVTAGCRVRARNAAGRYGRWSYLTSVTPQSGIAEIVPGAPARLAAQRQPGGRLTVAWSPPAATGRASVTGYTLDVCPRGSSCPSGAPLRSFGARARSAVLDASALPTRGYNLVVRARNGAGNGSGARTWGGAPRLRAPAVSSSASATRNFPLTWQRPSSTTYPAGTRYTVWQSTNGSPQWRPVVSGLRGGRYPVRGLPGTTYRFKVQAVLPGGAGSVVQVPTTTVVPFDDRAATTSRGWTRLTSASRYLGSALRTSDDGAVAALRQRGRRIQIIGDRGPNLGKFRVRVDGGAWRLVDTRASSSGTRKVLWTSGALRNAMHTVRVENLAAPGRPRITIDGFAFRR